MRASPTVIFFPPHAAWQFTGIRLAKGHRMTPLDGTTTSSEPSDATANPFLRDALDGLRARPKRLSPKYFYDLDGSRLFDAICELPEYYVTRTETLILEQHVRAIADHLGECRVIEPSARAAVPDAAASGRARADALPRVRPRRHRRTAPQARAAAPHDLAVAPGAPVRADHDQLPARVNDGVCSVVYSPAPPSATSIPPMQEQLLRRFRHAAGLGKMARCSWASI